jgi:uncharacterized 2Fe-2S/4Fe-4S cluster protein (DUF4445 family)
MVKEMIQVQIKEKGTFSLQKGESVLSVLRKENLMDFSHCGGNGTCGRCVVRFLKGTPLPLPADRRRFTPEELREGWRLACMAKPQSDCVLELHFPKEQQFILTKSALMPDGLENAEAGGGADGLENAETDGESEEPENAEVDGNPKGEVCSTDNTFLIADLGTTTIVVQLISRQTGRVLATYQEMNPQRKYGADVIARMQQSMAGKAQELADSVRASLERGVRELLNLSEKADSGSLSDGDNSSLKNAGVETESQKDMRMKPQLLVIAGNTVMVHLLMQYDVTGLSKAPFIPVSTAELSLQAGGMGAVIMPGISAFVGGDIVAGIMACGKKMEKDKITYALLIDLGTNGELALIGPERILCTATAAGPAFEGGATANVPGSDMIKIVAEFLEDGMLDETGLLKEPYFEQGIVRDGVMLHQEDIRSLQMAKAAVFAGIRILIREYGISEAEVDRIYLAGGFGYKLSTTAACRIGLIPVAMRERTEAVGNTALAGAYLYGKEKQRADVSPDGERQPGHQPGQSPAADIIRRAAAINLAKIDDFNEIYLQSMNLQEY